MEIQPQECHSHFVELAIPRWSLNHGMTALMANEISSILWCINFYCSLLATSPSFSFGRAWKRSRQGVEVASFPSSLLKNEGRREPENVARIEVGQWFATLPVAKAPLEVTTCLKPLTKLPYWYIASRSALCIATCRRFYLIVKIEGKVGQTGKINYLGSMCALNEWLMQIKCGL